MSIKLLLAVVATFTTSVATANDIHVDYYFGSR